MDDVLCLQSITAGDLGAAGFAAAQRPAFGEQIWTGGAMDRAVNAAAAEQRPVRRVDDCIERKRGDVGNADIKPRGADLGGNQRRHVPMRQYNVSRPLGLRFGGQVDRALHADIVEMVIQKPAGGALAVDMQRLKEIVVGRNLLEASNFVPNWSNKMR